MLADFKRQFSVGILTIANTMISEVKATVRTPDSVQFWHENVQLSQLLLREPLNKSANVF